MVSSTIVLSLVPGWIAKVKRRRAGSGRPDTIEASKRPGSDTGDLTRSAHALSTSSSSAAARFSCSPRTTKPTKAMAAPSQASNFISFF
jgi:hypothetical protein